MAFQGLAINQALAIHHEGFATLQKKPQRKAQWFMYCLFLDHKKMLFREFKKMHQEKFVLRGLRPLGYKPIFLQKMKREL